jgi:outer membrane protein assembly factor BamB
MSKRERFDYKRPDARQLSDQIVHGAFITEGTMVAFPTCFPAVTVPLPGDESRITALDVASDGMVYAGTSGYASHLLVGMFHGVTGMVFDLGIVEGANRSVAIVSGRDRFVAALNGPGGGRLVTRKLEPLPFDLIQEWHVARTPLTEIGKELEGEKIAHMVGDASGTLAIGVTETRLFRLDIASSAIEVVAKLPGRGRLARGAKGGIFGLDEGNTLWRYDVAAGSLQRKAVALPAGSTWSAESLRWGRDTVNGTLYTADDEGALFAFDEGQGFSAPLAKLPVAPAGPMAVTLDGRLYGTFGEGMSMLFCYDPLSAKLSTLGVAVSVLERRRYGYSFGDAAVGRDGQIFFGEDDDLGHLWMYFPKIQPRPR